jgi:4-hydroxy-tetrahydrodipicolinate reductase
MIRVHVHGAEGRLGKEIVKVGTEEADLKLTGSGRTSEQDNSSLLRAAEVLIDVSSAEGSIQALNLCVTNGKPLIIGSTGHDSEQLGQIKMAATKIPIVLAPNFSIGVNLLFWLTDQATKVLGADYDVEIVELHHRLKKDAPSGTAKRIGEIISAARQQTYEENVKNGRSGFTGIRTDHEIGIHAVRGGDIIGQGERMELTLRSSSRRTYALGALRAARWILNQPAKLYDMQNVLGL